MATPLSPMPSAPSSPRGSRLTVPEVRAESEALFRSIGDGAIATDELGHITRINPTALTILGLEPHEALGQWFPRVVTIVKADGTPLSLIDRPIVRMFLTGKAITEKAFYRAKNGTIVPVGVTVSPIILHGRPVGAIEVFRDITLENEIDRMKSEFISLASHQLRTPLATIKTYAHMLAENYMEPLEPEQSRAVQTIIAAANNMNELIGTLLNIARIESGIIAMTPQRLDMNLLAADAVRQFQLAAENKGLRLSLHPSKRAATLQTDNLIVREVLANLIGNAVKYTPADGQVDVYVRRRPRDVLVTVQDTGIGIPGSAQDKIFSKFFRAPNVTRQETTGTGLGLYVVRGLIDTLQGAIWFDSDEAHGSTFYVSLPLRQTPAAGVAEAAPEV
ncbi:MAG TPA: PAS domain-containing sensor histidine kinase [Candidatus Saccharimonadales bacterium]|nr:PAS domain-containing sensor histidine kinase [Candidatus Saccharimonadales bacterium]